MTNSNNKMSNIMKNSWNSTLKIMNNFNKKEKNRNNNNL